ncbi:MAG: hypothetical protein LQ351_004375 [Letrouitia transgressa]|nr:MAG: hypothetical protein LQ351_004375 [Letrouitia transgressa]
MFSDLPHIDLCNTIEQQQQQQQQLSASEDDWELSHMSHFDPVRMAEVDFTKGEFGATRPFSSYQNMSNVQRFLQHEEQPYFIAAQPRSDSDYPQLIGKNHPPLDMGLCEASPPWPLPRDSCIPETLSSDWNTPEDSSSGATNSGWSPRTNESYQDHDQHYLPWNETPRVQARLSYGGFVPNISEEQSVSSTQSATGIALSEIQQWPDPEPEAISRKVDMHDLQRPCPSSMIDPRSPYRSIPLHEPRLDDEGIGSSIHNSAISSPFQPSEERVVRIEDLKDDGSGYSPPSRSKNASRRQPTSHSTSSNPKASPSRKRSKCPKNPANPMTTSTKITKRRSSTAGSCTRIPSMTVPSQDNSESKSACPHCAVTFASPSAMTKHILASHTRPFTCAFRRYGCVSTFGSKNEWKRHVSSQHLRLGIYRCDLGACVPHPKSTSGYRRLSSGSNNSRSEAMVSSHNDFNRKDLFTQHLRRMHGPAHTASKEEVERFNAELEIIQSRCWISLRETPTRTVCGFCAVTHQSGSKKEKDFSFDGKGTWDDRMEHVGRHLEKGDVEEAEDVGLRDYMVKEGLLEQVKGGGWKVFGSGSPRRRGRGSKCEAEDETREADAMAEDE